MNGLHLHALPSPLCISTPQLRSMWLGRCYPSLTAGPSMQVKAESQFAELGADSLDTVRPPSPAAQALLREPTVRLLAFAWVQASDVEVEQACAGGDHDGDGGGI